MKMKFKKMLCLVLMIVMIASISVPYTFAADSGKHDYTFIGDSITSGFGMRYSTKWSSQLATESSGYVYWQRPLGMHQMVPSTYPAIVADALGIKSNQTSQYYNNLARVGARSTEVRRYLDSDYNAQIAADSSDMGNTTILNEGGTAGMTSAELKELLDTSASYISQSKLITIMIGANDINYAISGPLYTLYQSIASSGAAKLLTGNLSGLSFYDIYNTLLQAGVSAAAIGSLVIAVNSAVATFETNYKAIIDKIYELNPDATIVAMGIINPLENLMLDDAGTISLGQFFQLGNNVVNTYIQNLGLLESGRDYRYADISGVELEKFSKSFIGYAMTADYNTFYTDYDNVVHPGYEQHKAFAAKILEVLGSDFSLWTSSASTSTATTNTTQNNNETKFYDVSSSAWYYDAVKYVSSKGYMNGVSSNEFGVDYLLTRAQAVQIMYSIAGKPSPGGFAGFGDIYGGEWYYNAVNWAANNGIAKGNEYSAFCPNDYITRQQLAVMLKNFAGYLGKNTTASGNIYKYSDWSDISDYAKDGISWAIGNGIMSGKNNNRLDPKGNATRAEMAQMVMKMMNI